MAGPIADLCQDTSWAVGGPLSFWRTLKLYVDVEFRRENVPYLYAHKLVLCIWSPEFADMMEQGNKESPIVLHFTEDVNLMEAVLEYLYSGPLSDDFNTRIPVQKLIQVIDISERLGIRQLQKRCLSSLQRKKIDPANVITILDYGLKKNLETTVMKCIKVITEKGVYEDCLDNTVSLATVEAILRMERISLESEAVLLKLALSWLSHPTNKRYKSEVLSLVDLSSIQWNEYQNVWKKFKEFFTHAELTSILLAVAQEDFSLFPDWYKQRMSSTVETGCDMCLVARKLLTLPRCHLLNFPKGQMDIAQAFDFVFETSERARLVSVELNVGPRDFPESEFNVKFNVFNRNGMGQWRGCRLDYARKRNAYNLIFNEPMKLKENDILHIKFYFSRGLKESKIKCSMPNILEKKKLNQVLNESCVKTEMKSSKLAFYCGGLEDPKFLVSSFCFRFCNHHITYLLRKPIKPGQREFRHPQYKMEIPKTELNDTSMIKKEEICIK